MNELMKLQDVADWLNCSIHTVREWARAKQIPSMKVGGQYRFEKEELEEWLRKKRVQKDG